MDEHAQVGGAERRRAVEHLGFDHLRAVFDAGEIELDREAAFRARSRLTPSNVPELARRRRRRRPPLLAARAGGTRFLIRTFVVMFALSSIDGPVDLFDAHRIRRRRIDHRALAPQHQRIAVIELRRPRFLVEQRQALGDLPPHLAHVAGAARIGDRLVDLIDLRLELAFRLRRRLERVVADRQRVDVRQRLRVAPGRQANRTSRPTEQRSA